MLDSVIIVDYSVKLTSTHFNIDVFEWVLVNITE